MTHLSDFSYLARCINWVYVLAYLGYSIYVADRFKCLRFKSIFSGELKTIITILLILMILMQFMWDMVSTYVKYNEGFVAVSKTMIISKPYMMWTPSHQSMMIAMDYVECVTFSLQTGVLFLLQSFWNYLSNTYAKKSFMGSLEFKFYIFWALGSMAMFPILQYVFRNDVNKREGIPQLAYGCESLIASMLGIRSHFRFKKLIALSSSNSTGKSKTIITRLSYFQEMNAMITFILFFYAASFIIICVDGLTEAKIINSNKFATDAIIANVNVCTILILLILISIFHPRPQYTRDFGETSASRTETNHLSYHKSSNGRANNFVNESKGQQFIGEAITTNNTKPGGFIRVMSPVDVDLSPLQNEKKSAVSLVNTTSTQDRYYNQTRSIAVEDPYSNEQIVFSMVDSSKSSKQQRYGSPTTTVSSYNQIPLRGMSNYYSNSTMSPQRNKFDEETNYSGSAYDPSETTSPTKARRPSWERTNNNNMSPVQQYTSQTGNNSVQDWLWKSPNRRNP